MSKKEKDYSNYLRHLSNLTGMLSLFSGFVFTAYTILITRLPDPSTITAQMTLFVCSAFLGVFSFCAAYFNMMASVCVQDFPQLTKEMRIVNVLFFASTSAAMGFLMALMSFLLNLEYLAIAQLISWIFFGVMIYIFIIRRGWQYRKSKSSEQ